jgi:hypothetical protein
VCQLRTRWLPTCERWKVKSERLPRSMSDAHHDRSQRRIGGQLKERLAGLLWTEIPALP